MESEIYQKVQAWILICQSVTLYLRFLLTVSGLTLPLNIYFKGIEVCNGSRERGNICICCSNSTHVFFGGVGLSLRCTNKEIKGRMKQQE